jgi:hypothetical protein
LIFLFLRNDLEEELTLREELFLEERAVSGENRFWRREPFLEKGARFWRMGPVLEREGILESAASGLY